MNLVLHVVNTPVPQIVDTTGCPRKMLNILD